MLGNETLAVGPDAASENHFPVVRFDREVVDVERVVRREVFAHQAAQLAVAQVLEVIQIFEIARHGFTRFCGDPRRRSATAARTTETSRG